MKSIPLPVLLAAVAGVIALPVRLEVAGLLLLAAGMGAIICVDYSQRYRGLRLPRTRKVRASRTRQPFPRSTETNRLAA